jgi:hypothetical protein
VLQCPNEAQHVAHIKTNNAPFAASSVSENLSTSLSKMAEVIGFVASIITVIQVSEDVMRICKFYIESVRGAPADLRVRILV